MALRLFALLLLLSIFGLAFAANACGFLDPLSTASPTYQQSGNFKRVWASHDFPNFDDISVQLLFQKSPGVQQLGVYTGGAGFGNVGPALEHLPNLQKLFGRRSSLVVGGAYNALEEEAEAAAKGEFAPISKYRAIPGQAIAYADSFYNQGRFLPRNGTGYDINTTPDTDDKSIPVFLQSLRSLRPNEKVTIFSSGTLGWIAKLFSAQWIAETTPLLNRIEALVLMGGAVNTSGNLYTKPSNVAAEFNIYCDPHGAQWAFGNFSANRIPITMVPLDATNDVPLQLTTFDVLYQSPATPEAQLAGRLVRAAYFDGAYLWDATAAIVMLYPNVVRRARNEKIRVVIDQGVDGPLQGATRICTAAEAAVPGACADIRVVYDVDGAAVTNTFINLMQSPVNTALNSLVCPY